ncbi:MAG: homoserine dehydrogenase [Clostridia bacterium]|nr:homoserine dehydrogenase [Clostridia bacterium]
MKTIRVGFLGCGNIGCGVYRLLLEQSARIAEDEGLAFDIRSILVRDRSKKRNAKIPQALLTECAADVTDDPETDVVAEFLGGTEPAASLMIRALRNGKTVVTANKMALASRWNDILAAAKEGGAGLLFEASVGGAIPVIRCLTDSLQANEILSVSGIVNGTTNYILTRMSDAGLTYEAALAEAQQLGYAEPDPTADVEGVDAAYKLSILSSLAFRRHVSPEQIRREGITGVAPEEIAAAREAGCAVKLLATARQKDGRITAEVKPQRVPAESPLYGVKDAFNAVLIEGSACGDMMLYGRGAGDRPTASAVVSDLIRAGHGGFRLPPMHGEAVVSQD